MQNIRITIKSFDNYYGGIAVNKIYDIVHFLEIDTVKQYNAIKKTKKLTVLKSPHIDKKAREQFEMRRSKKTLFLKTYLCEKDKFLTLTLLLLEICKNVQLFGVEIQIDLEFKGILH